METGFPKTTPTVATGLGRQSSEFPPYPSGQQGQEAPLTQSPSSAQQHQDLPRGPGQEQPGGGR